MAPYYGYLLLRSSACLNKVGNLIRSATPQNGSSIHLISRHRVSRAQKYFLNDMKCPLAFAVVDLAFERKDYDTLERLTAAPPDEDLTIAVETLSPLYLIQSLKRQHPSCTVMALTDRWHSGLSKALTQAVGIDLLEPRESLNTALIENLLFLTTLNRRTVDVT